MAYTFSDRVTKPTSSRSNNRRRRETTSSSSHNHTSSSPSTATYTFENSSAVLSASEFHDGHSLTYSASSSQAGESTDSSLADIERMVERDQQLQMITNQNERHGNGNGNGHSSHSHSHSQHFIRQSSSLGYSTGTDDADFHEYHVHGRRGNNNSSHRQDLQQQQQQQQQYQSGNKFYRGQSPSGQQSASQGNDGGYHQSQNQRAMYKSTPNQNKHKSKKSSSDSFSPTTVSADISNGSAHTPPPRHVKRLSADDNNELWYQKWWMCGFTDAFSS